MKRIGLFVILFFNSTELFAQSGKFSLLTYNTAGLPGLISAVDGKFTHHRIGLI